MSSLPRLTPINDTYVAGRILRDVDGFGNIYRGWDVNTEEKVTIHEYFPHELATRNDEKSVTAQEGKEEIFQYGLGKFINESKILQQLDHENIVGEYMHIKRYGTAYRVFEQEAGASLLSGLERKEGKLPERAALAILRPMLDGLEKVHEEGIIHGQLSPEAIFLAKSGRPILRDFGSAKLHLARRNGQLQELLAPEYASPEQYLTDGRIGPWMDVYGWGAVLYRVLSGEAPPPAKERLQDDTLPDQLEQMEGASDGLRRSLHQVLALDPSERPSSVSALRELLDNPPQAPEESDEESSSSPAVSSEESEEAEEVEEVEESEMPLAEAAGAGVAAEEVLDEDDDDEEAFGEKNEDEPVDEQQGPADAPEPAPEADQEETPLGSFLQYDDEDASSIEADSLDPKESPAEEPASDETDSSAPEKSIADEEAQSTPAPAADRPAQAPDERERSRVVERDESESNPMLLYGGGAILLVALLGGSLFFLLNDDSAQARPSQSVMLKRRGDSLFDRGKFQLAMGKYKAALQKKPNDPYPQRQIAEAKKQLHRIKERRYYASVDAGDSLLARGKKLVEQGDSAQARKAFSKSNRKFLKALDNKPNDSLALARVNTVSSQLFSKKPGNSEKEQQEAEEKKGEAFRAQMFTYIRDQAETLFDKGEYLASKQRFKEALDLKETEYVQGKLEEIDGLISKQKANKRYEEHMDRGRQYLASGELSAAQAAFDQALTAKPEDSTAQHQLNQLKSQIAKKNNQKRYKALRVEGKKQMKQKNYKAAMKNFREALNFKPNDSFAKGKIAESKQKIKKAKRKEEAYQSSRVDENGIYKVPDQPPSMIGTLADLVKKIKYPSRAYNEQIEGKVFLRFIVNEEGKVTKANPVKGRELGFGTDQAAIKALKKIRFEPATVDGEPVKAWHTIMVKFQSSDFDEE